MKIGMIAPLPPPYGGIANWVVLLREYVQGVEDVDFIHINTAPKVRATEGRTMWDRVVVQGFAMLGKNRDMKRMIRRDRPDVIHMTTSGQLAVVRDHLMLKTARKAHVPTVYHIRFGRVPEIAEANTQEWRMLRRAMGLATKVMVIDSATERAVRLYAPEVDVCCVPNPIDLQKIPCVQTSPTDRAERQLVFMGWVVETKGVEELLMAWEKIREDHPAWSLRIVGPCLEAYRVELEKHYSLERVIFDGEKEHDEAMRILASADAFVLPSHTEGFPNVVLEAMALSRPIVATDVGAIPDMLAEGCGVVVPRKNADALSAALTALLANEAEREAMGQRARAKMEQVYDIETVFDAYTEVWAGL